jgi:hypothetical protein
MREETVQHEGDSHHGDDNRDGEQVTGELPHDRFQTGALGPGRHGAGKPPSQDRHLHLAIMRRQSPLAK